MKNLQLPLKTIWFKMTQDKIKTEDYREINQYWFKRLVFDYEKVFKYCTGYNWYDDLYRDEGIQYIAKHKQTIVGFKPFDVNTMTLGYPKSTDTDKILKLEHKGIEIRTGNPDWGAEPNKLYFVIKHGTILS